MISYRPTPELTPGRRGFRAAVGAMALAAVLGTTAFAPMGAEAAAPGPDTRAAVVGATVPADPALVRRQGAGGSLGQATASPLRT
ncbi:hypothetical protein [Arthrobacter agilis]|uniref:hypothetical protein n=1 Tax=Arthrobacter agilis TaxID=37921 RepID=UPI00277FAB31|nr:hypothetical protein [Arthrobacter agilis]MDQ0736131.1 hypothetical protein [Arthrobacter agilis]